MVACQCALLTPRTSFKQLVMELETEKPLHEKIIAVQSQMRIAIQNHYMLLQRKKNFPMETELDSHIKVLQYLLLNMGRAQADLMERYRLEISTKYNLKPNSPEVINIMKNYLKFPEAPKNVPVYNKARDSDENKKIGSWKTKPMKSLLKVNNVNNNAKSTYLNIGNQKVNASDVKVDRSKIKIVYKGKKESQNTVLVQQPKKLQSVLKSKNVTPNIADKTETIEEGRNSPESSSTSSSSSDLKSKVSSSRSNSPVEESETSEPAPPPAKKMDTRYGRKYEARSLGKTKIKILSDRLNLAAKKQIASLAEQERKATTQTIRSTPRSSNQEPVTIDEVDKEVFLGFFGLVSKEKCEMLKKKRCERKRRSVAGQSSLYSDYLQPLPKRTYTPRKPPAPAPVISNNAVIVESPPIDDDEDEKPVKAQSCVICHEDELVTGVLEVCHSCSENYHFKCLPVTNKGCPSCMAQSTDIPSIVGANNSVGNASSSELIKRYSNDEQSSGLKSVVTKKKMPVRRVHFAERRAPWANRNVK